MADLADVETTLATLIAGWMYPSGTGGASAIAADVKVYAGWPVAAKLDADLRLGNVVHISVFGTESEKNTSRYLEEWGELSRPAKTLGATVGATSITLTGSIATHQHISALVNGKAYAYALQAGDTLATVATALAALINANTAATASGAVITIPGAHAITVRIGVDGTIGRVVRRQEKQFLIDIWSPTPDLRTAAARIIDPKLSGLDFITLPDNTAGRIKYVHSRNIDEGQKQLVYRRNITYSVDYATVDTDSATEVTIVGVNDGNSGMIAYD